MQCLDRRYHYASKVSLGSILSLVRVVGARLVDPSRLPALADLQVPLPGAHDALHADAFPGDLHERVLVVDLEGAEIGAALLVHVYPVAQRGTATILVGEAGRTRCFAALRPTVEHAGEVTIDIEWRGEELWVQEDLPVGPTTDSVARAVADAHAGAQVRDVCIEFGGPHGLQVEIETLPHRVVARFFCDVPVSLIARTADREHPWHRLPWDGPFQWFAEDRGRVDSTTLSTFRRATGLLARHRVVEVRLRRQEGTIVVACPDVDVVSAGSIVSAIVDAVKELPVPTRTPAQRDDARATAVPLPAVEVLEASVLDVQEASVYLADASLPLPSRDAPFHAAHPSHMCRTRVAVADIQRPDGCPGTSLSVWIGDSPVAHMAVPAGNGICRASATMRPRYLRQARVTVSIWSDRGVLWQRRVTAGLSKNVFLDELAACVPGSTRGGDVVLVAREGRPPARLALWLDAPDDDFAREAAQFQDPLVRFMNRVRGVRPEAPVADPADDLGAGEPARLEILLSGTRPVEVSRCLAGLPVHVSAAGLDTLVVCDIRRADVSEVVGMAATILRAGSHA